MSTVKPNHAKAFRIVRAALGVLQCEFAQALGITTSQLSKIETGSRLPSSDVLARMAFASGATPELIKVLAVSTAENSTHAHADDVATMLTRFLLAADESHSKRMRRVRQLQSQSTDLSTRA